MAKVYWGLDFSLQYTLAMTHNKIKLFRLGNACKTIPDPPPVIIPPLCSDVSIWLSIKPKIGISIAKMLNTADNKSLWVPGTNLKINKNSKFKQVNFLTWSNSRFCIQILCSNRHFNCSNICSCLRKKVKKYIFCFKNCFELSLSQWYNFFLQIWGFCSYHHTVLLLKISAYSMQFTWCNFQRICPSSEHSALCTVEDYWQKNCHNGGSVALIREMGWLYIIDTIQDFLCKWGMKPCMQLF